MMDCLRDRSGRSERAGWLWSTDHGRASTVGERARAGKRTPAACGTEKTQNNRPHVWNGGGVQGARETAAILVTAAATGGMYEGGVERGE